MSMSQMLGAFQLSDEMAGAQSLERMHLYWVYDATHHTILHSFLNYNSGILKIKKQI